MREDAVQRQHSLRELFNGLRYVIRYGITWRAMPDDLRGHACIRIRLPSGKPYRWEFEQHGQELTVDVPGTLTLDSPELILQAASAGLGLAYVSDRSALPLIERGALLTVLDDWCPQIPGLFLYYPGHRHVPPGLRAFLEVLKEAG